MFNSILVVCVGNICRSPIGERLLKKLFPEKKVSSAGLAAMVNKSADPTAIFIAESNGLSLEGHIAQQITSALCQEYDLILVMEKEHIDIICRLVPEARGKVMLYGHWNNKLEIADPYRKSQETFEITYQYLSKAAQKWAHILTH